MKTILLSVLISLVACAPDAPPCPTHEDLRVYVSDTWDPKTTFYVRRAFGADVIEVANQEDADVTIWPVEPHAENCSHGAGSFTGTVYVDTECFWGDELTAKVRELLASYR